MNAVVNNVVVRGVSDDDEGDLHIHESRSSILKSSSMEGRSKDFKGLNFKTIIVCYAVIIELSNMKILQLYSNFSSIFLLTTSKIIIKLTKNEEF